MHTNAALGSIAVSILVFAHVGCSPPPPPKEPAPPPKQAEPPPEEPQEVPKEPVETGIECATAEAQCGGGVCVVSMNNKCEQPVTCDLVILTVCEASHDLVQVKSRSRDTVPAKIKGELATKANCTSGNPVSTRVDALSCK